MRRLSKVARAGLDPRAERPKPALVRAAHLGVLENLHAWNGRAHVADRHLCSPPPVSLSHRRPRAGATEVGKAFMTRGAFTAGRPPATREPAVLPLPLLDGAQEWDDSIYLRHLHRAHLPLGPARRFPPGRGRMLRKILLLGFFLATATGAAQTTNVATTAYAQRLLSTHNELIGGDVQW